MTLIEDLQITKARYYTDSLTTSETLIVGLGVGQGGVGEYGFGGYSAD